MESLEGVLRKHVIKFHHNQNICETCGRVFNDPRLFDVHVKSAHSDVRDHFCDRCGKVSTAHNGVLCSPKDNSASFFAFFSWYWYLITYVPLSKNTIFSVFSNTFGLDINLILGNPH